MRFGFLGRGLSGFITGFRQANEPGRWLEPLEGRRLLSAGVIDAGDGIDEARNLGSLSLVRPLRVNESIGSADAADCFRFSVGSQRNVSIKLDRLADNLDLQLLNAGGSVVAESKRDGAATEYIAKLLKKGDYFLRVVGGDSGAASTYRLNIAGTTAEGFFALAAQALAATSAPSGELFLFVKAARGDVAISRYKDWIDINTYGWTVQNPVDPGGAGGGSKPIFSEINIAKVVDVASVPLFRLVVAHAVENNVAIALYDSKTRVERLRITLNGVQLTSLSTTHTDGSAGEETLRLAFTTIQIRFTKVDANGNAGAVIEGGWNIQTDEPI